MSSNHITEKPTPERLAYSVSEAVAATGIGRTSLYGLMNRGELAFTKIGARRLIPARDLKLLLHHDF